MKTIYKKLIILFTTLLSLFIYQSCSEILDEEPKTLFTVAYFETPQGIKDAVNTVYDYMRFIYAPNGPLALFHQGTDEWTYGEQPATSTSGDNLQHRECGEYSLSAGNGAIGSIWNFSFPMINMCNAILEYVDGIAELTEQEKKVIKGEASFFRALYYLNLVTQYGAVPLDLGSGELKMNTKPFWGFNRLPLDQLLEKNYQTMIDDLTFATQNLPERKNENNYKVTQAAAYHLLAKVYMFRYYTAAKKADDAQNAYNAAMEVINNQEKYGVKLLDNFADVFRQGNDYNTEILYAVERIPGDNAMNMMNNPTGIGAYENQANNDFTPNYQQAIGNVSLIDGRPLAYQRPLRKIAPTKWMLLTAFADKVNATRYHSTFRTLYRTASVNEPGTKAYDEYVLKLADRGMVVGDTAWYMPDTQAEADAINARGVNYFCIGPDDWYTNQNKTYIMHPALIKFADSLRVTFNDGSGRPYPVCRLAETYLLAAEAAMQLNKNDEAADLINVLKKRAAYKPGLTPEEVDARYANIAVTGANINLDFILDERTREMAGEWVRWSDLAIRKYPDGKSCLIERAKAFNPDVAASNNLDEHHLVRPIPQGQIDAVDDPDRAKYQNPGY